MVVIFSAPCNVFYAGMPGPGAVLEHVVWSAEAIYHNWTRTLPATAAAVAGTWAALEVLGRLPPDTRRRALGVILALLGAVTVAKSWQRPDLPADYAQSAFADLGAAAFLAALAIPLALGALWPRRRRASATQL